MKSYAELISIPFGRGKVEFRSSPPLDGYEFRYVNYALQGRRFGVEFITTDGRRNIALPGIDAHVLRKWFSPRGLNLGVLGNVEFHWPARDSIEYWSVEARKQPEGEIIELRIEDRVGLRFKSRCTAEWNSEVVKPEVALAVLSFFWVMAERDRTFNA